MDWNGSMSLRTFVSRPLDAQSSSPLLYNIYNLDQLPVLEMKQPLMIEDQAQQVLVGGNGIMDQKKKRLSNEQLESLERSFQEEIKLDPDRKMKLSKELGLQPKQIAVWFQNRRARWKNKHLEHLYDSLKQEFDTISREKHMLQQEVEKLRRMLREQVGKNQVSTTQTDISGEETVESTSMIKSSDNYIYNVEDFNQISAVTSFWSAAQPQIPSYPLD